MYKRMVYIAFIWVTMLGSIIAKEPPHNYYPGMVLVKFSRNILSRPNLPNITLRDIKSDKIRAFLKRHNFTSGEKMFKHFEPKDTLWTTKDVRTVKLIDLSTYYALKVDINADIPRVVDSLMQMEGIIWAGPNGRVEPAGGVYPDDPFFKNGSQWGLWDKFDEQFHRPRVDIRAPEAWEFQKGRSDVIVAVVDGGVDYNHEDLDPGDRSRVIEGIDTGDNDNDPMDNLTGDWGGHGTAVAGIIGAMTDNNRGVAGVMWNLKIMPVKVAGEHSIGPFHWELAYQWDIAEGIDWARAHGADVINMSLGGHDWWWHIFESPVVSAIVNAFRSGIVLAAAMGNDDTDRVEYPAGYYETIAVGATNYLDQIASFSNYGPHIDVAAPGVNTYTTMRDNGYGGFSGTSCATPFVSGLAGLIISETRDKGINFYNEDVRWLIRLTADDRPPQGIDDSTGYGRINAGRAIQVLNLPYKITMTQGDMWQVSTNSRIAFLNPPRYDLSLSAGTYWCDVYRLELDRTFNKSYADTPLVWFTPRGYSSASPNNAREYLHKEVSKNSVRMWTYFFYIKRDIQGRTINKWAPINPYDYGLRCVIIGRHRISTPTALNAQPYITTALLTWQDNSDNEAGYEVWMREKGGEWQVVDTTVENQHIDTISGLLYGKTYEFRVRGFAQTYHSNFSNTVTIKMLLSPPEDLRAEVSYPYIKVNLRWNDVLNIYDGHILKIRSMSGAYQTYNIGNVDSFTFYGMPFVDYACSLRAYTDTFYSDARFISFSNAPEFKSNGMYPTGGYGKRIVYADGKLHTVYVNGNRVIYHSSSDGGLTWNDSSVVYTEREGEWQLLDPTIDANENGDVVIAWTRWIESEQKDTGTLPQQRVELYYNYKRSNETSFRGPFIIEQYSYGILPGTQVSMNILPDISISSEGKVGLISVYHLRVRKRDIYGEIPIPPGEGSYEETGIVRGYVFNIDHTNGESNLFYSTQRDNVRFSLNGRVVKNGERFNFVWTDDRGNIMYGYYDNNFNSSYRWNISFISNGNRLGLVQSGGNLIISGYIKSDSFMIYRVSGFAENPGSPDIVPILREPIHYDFQDATIEGNTSNLYVIGSREGWSSRDIELVSGLDERPRQEFISYTPENEGYPHAVLFNYQGHDYIGIIYSKNGNIVYKRKVLLPEPKSGIQTEKKDNKRQCSLGDNKSHYAENRFKDL